MIVIMPSKSPEQAALMRAAAKDKEFADKIGISQRVAKEFVRADARRAKLKSKKKTT